MLNHFIQDLSQHPSHHTQVCFCLPRFRVSQLGNQSRVHTHAVAPHLAYIGSGIPQAPKIIQQP